MTGLKVFAYKITKANGPGLRLCFWVAGCNIGCKGCWNQTVNESPGTLMSIDEIIAIIKQAQKEQGIQGVTFSGGEPLSQKKAFTQLVKAIAEETNLSTILFTGLTFDEIKGMRDKEFIDHLDVIFSGRFDAELWSPDNPMAHKDVFLLTERYDETDFQDMATVEYTIADTGQVTLTGIDSHNLI